MKKFFSVVVVVSFSKNLPQNNFSFKKKSNLISFTRLFTEEEEEEELKKNLLFFSSFKEDENYYEEEDNNTEKRENFYS